jgi:site-specific DNA-methyltransferase (adenine-specific)
LELSLKRKRTNYNRAEHRVINGYNEIPKEKYYEFSIKWITQAFRVLKETGSMYVFSGWTNLKDILNAIDEVGFKLINHIIWKYQFGVYTRRKFVTSHYHILFLAKNEKKYKFNKVEKYPEDVWVINREYWIGDKKTPTKLPAELVKKILLYSSDENDIVLDPFLGSGQVAVVCKMMKRNFIGFEIVKEYYEFAEKRLKEELYRVKEEEGLELFSFPEK